MIVKNLLKRSVITLAAFALTSVAMAQITAPGSNVKYDTGVAVMPAFIYYSTSESATNATLSATHPVAGTSAIFLWELYDNATSSYTSVGATPTISSIGAGSYRVTLTNVGGGLYNDTTMYAAVVMDVLMVNGVTYTNDCDQLVLSVNQASKPTHTFYDLSKTPAESVILSLNPTIEWQSSPVDIYDGLNILATWKNATDVRSPTIVTTVIGSPAPLVAASYTPTLRNRFGNSATIAATPQIPAMAAYGVMKIEEEKDGNWAVTTAPNGSALYRLRFDHSQSKNADTYTWIGMDNYTNVQTRSKVLWTRTTTDRTELVYPKYDYQGHTLDGYIPGRYLDSLIVLNSVTGCKSAVDLTSISTAPDAEKPFIVVNPSKFDSKSMPNVFTPNGDGTNDVFKFVKGAEPVSMRAIDLRIFDRAGKELYHYNGDVEGWLGWNGKLKGTGGDCAAGVYYYIISGTGWDNVSYSGSPYKGFVHLFRE